MLNPFTCESLVIKSKWATLNKVTMNRSVWRVNCLPHQAAGLSFKQAAFLKTNSFFSLGAISRGHKLGSHTAYQSCTTCSLEHQASACPS